MTKRADHSRAAGFTLVEVLVVLTVMLVIALLGIPALLNMVHRSKIEGITRQTAVLMQSARLEAIKTGRPAMVVANTLGNELFAFVDDATDPPNQTFDAGEEVLGRFPLPRGVTFSAPGAQDAINGFTLADGPIFQLDGSVIETGSLRVGDTRGNFLEIRVEPAATGRVGVLKWDGSQWRAAGEGGKPWEWK